ncbi:MAG TPA: DUF2089 domain-containing protein [Acidimicrobiales bacterium]|nr:DUF2089 domain-containing protein [Acidimicrobiales bacterium]
MTSPSRPLPTRDPFGGAELVVTRLESPDTGVTIEGRFTLGWMGRLTPEQLELVGLLLARRNNLQRLANDLDIAYNTARNRFEEIVAALGGPPEDRKAIRADVLRRVEAGELTPEEAADLLG